MMEPVLDEVMRAQQAGITATDPTSLMDYFGACYSLPFGQTGFDESPSDSPFNSMYDAGRPFVGSTSSGSEHMSPDNDDEINASNLVTNQERSNITRDGKKSLKERRRTQNRLAQRAYRQRKEQAIRGQEEEIQMLKTQLVQEKNLNQSLATAIGLLRERLKRTQPDTIFATQRS